MKIKLLALTASLRDENSVTRALTEDLVAALPPGTEVRERRIRPDTIRGPDAFWVEANQCPETERSPAMREALALSDELIRELLEATHIVLAAPMYNFSIPWTLKAYIDLIVRAGHTFSYDPTTSTFAPRIAPKPMAFLTASAGAYSEPPFADFDLCERYVRVAFGFMGLRDIRVAKAEKRWMAAEAREASEARARQEARAIAWAWSQA